MYVYFSFPQNLNKAPNCGLISDWVGCFALTKKSNTTFNFHLCLTVSKQVKYQRNNKKIAQH